MFHGSKCFFSAAKIHIFPDMCKFFVLYFELFLFSPFFLCFCVFSLPCLHPLQYPRSTLTPADSSCAVFYRHTTVSLPYHTLSSPAHLPLISRSSLAHLPLVSCSSLGHLPLVSRLPCRRCWPYIKNKVSFAAGLQVFPHRVSALCHTPSGLLSCSGYV